MYWHRSYKLRRSVMYCMGLLETAMIVVNCVSNRNGLGWMAESLVFKARRNP